MSRTMRCQGHCDPAPEYKGAYRVKRWPGVAVRVRGWETEPLTVTLCPSCDYEQHEREHGGGAVVSQGDRDCDHDGAYQSDEPAHERTGRLIVVMIGDDRPMSVDPGDVEQLGRAEYCGECGQIGCGCDAYDDE